MLAKINVKHPVALFKVLDIFHNILRPDLY
jgi:hypothetical protein